MGYSVISLGSACQVKANIDKFFSKQVTHFFDWLITDFKTVLYVLYNINHPEYYLSEQKITDEDIFKYGKSWHPLFHKIENRELKMISIHDFPSETHYSNSINEFINKYNRRIERLKNIIHSNENVHMIHCIDHQFTENYIMNNSDINDFFEFLHRINPNNKCILHIVVPPKIQINLDFLCQNNVFIYYLSDTYPCEIDWVNENFNWEIVFNNIRAIG